MKIGDAAAAVDGRAVGALVLTAIVVGAAGVCVSAMMSAFMEPPVRHTTATAASATATPPRNGSIRTWQADGHWWVVGDGWGQHHPGCPCHNKAEVE